MVSASVDAIAAAVAAFEPPAGPTTGERAALPKAKDMWHHLSDEAKSRRPSPLKEAGLYLKNPNLLSLGGGLPSPLTFPFDAIGATVPAAGHWSAGTGTAKESIAVPRYAPSGGSADLELARYLQYGQGTGQPAVLDFMRRHTEIVHRPQYADWDVMITAGNTNAIDTVFRMFLTRGDFYLVEEFTFPSVTECAVPQGLRPVPLKLDDQGIDPAYFAQVLDGWDAQARGGAKPRLLYTIPTGHNPTGANASLERRREILDICKRHDVILIEDDPYYFLFMEKYDAAAALANGTAASKEPRSAAEFLDSLPTSYLSLDTEGRVVRLDSLSKVLAPGLRCGWLSGSAQLMERALRHNEVGIQAPAGTTQALVAGLWRSWGHAGYLHWLVNLRAQYTARRDALLASMRNHLPHQICTYTPPDAGMFVWIKLDHTMHPSFAAAASDATAAQNGDGSTAFDLRKLEKEIFLKAVKEHEVLVAQGSWFTVAPESPRASAATHNGAGAGAGRSDGAEAAAAAHANGQAHVAREQAPVPGLFFRATFAAAPLDKMDDAMRRFGAALRDSFGLSTDDAAEPAAAANGTSAAAAEVDGLQAARKEDDSEKIDAQDATEHAADPIGP